MVHYPFNPAKELEDIRSYQREIKEEEQRRQELISEVEKATGKKMITVDDVEYYVDPLELKKLIGEQSYDHR